MTAPKGTGRRPANRTPAARTTTGAPKRKPASTAQTKPAAAARQRKAAARQPEAARSWWQNAWVVPAGVLSLAALLVIAVVAGRGSSNSGLPNNALRSPSPPTVADRVTSIPARTFATVGDGGVAQPLHLVTGQKALTGADGKPLLLFVGADYCPFCAAERWSVVVALSRFGQVGGLQLTSSSGSDAFPNTNTFDLSQLRFTSDVLDVEAVETSDRDGQPFQSLDPQQSGVFSAIGNGTIPFVDFGNRYLASSAGYDPGVLQGLTWDQIAAKLADANDSVTRAIVGNANRLTAAICAMTHDRPASVCQAAPIPQLESQLPTS